MTASICLALGAGLLLGGWAVLLWSSAKGKSIVADFVAAGLAIGIVVYFWSPAPEPASWAHARGWVTTDGGRLAIALGTLGTAAVVVLVARHVGLIERLARRFGA